MTSLKPSTTLASHSMDDPFLDIEIRIEKHEVAGYPIEITVGGEQVFDGWMAADAVSRVSSLAPTEDGQRLLRSLFADAALLSAWAEARGRSVRRRIRLRIAPDAPELHAAPWELLQDGNVMFAADADTPFSRYLPTEVPWGTAIETRPIRMLVAVSAPDDVDRYNLSPVDVAEEQDVLRRALMEDRSAGIHLDFLDAPMTLERLESALRQGYHVLHFVGHGVYSAQAQQAALFMQDDDGRIRRVLDDDLAGMLARQGVQPHVVFLAACQSAARSNTGSFLGLAPKLVAAGVPAVLAMQDRVTVTTARKFAATFYRRLLEYGLVDVAANEARSTLLTAGRFDAGVPVLFMRLKSGRVWDMVKAAGRQPADRLLSEAPADQPAWNTAVFRELLSAAFNDEELTTLCFDHFRPVYENFSAGMSKGQKIQHLLDHCERQAQHARLLDVVKSLNRAQYDRFAPRLRVATA